MLRLVYLAYRVYCFFVRPLTLGVRVALLKDGQVVLVRHTYIPGWYLPGGGVKRGETLEAAARREAREEVGAELGNIHLAGAYSNFTEWKSDHNLLFVSTDFTRTGKHDHEIAEIRTFSMDALPHDLWPGHRQRLQEYLAGAERPMLGEW